MEKKKTRSPAVVAPTLPSTDSWLQGLCFKRRDLHGENTFSVINIILTQMQEAQGWPDTVHHISVHIYYLSQNK